MITLDFGEFHAYSKSLGSAVDQLPFAISRTLNDAAEATRSKLISDTWPSHVVSRNRSFMNAALRVNKATKTNLAVEIYDRLNRAHLQMHAKGGTQQPKGTYFAIPSSQAIKRGAGGVPRAMRPNAIANRFEADLRGKGPAIWQRLNKRAAKKQKKRIRLVYVLKQSTPVPKDVPFYETFAETMRTEVAARFPDHLAHALATRKSK